MEQFRENWFEITVIVVVTSICWVLVTWADKAGYVDQAINCFTSAR